jgi:hypothetical protein
MSKEKFLIVARQIHRVLYDHRRCTGVLENVLVRCLPWLSPAHITTLLGAMEDVGVVYSADYPWTWLLTEPTSAEICHDWCVEAWFLQ